MAPQIGLNRSKASNANLVQAEFSLAASTMLAPPVGGSNEPEERPKTRGSAIVPKHLPTRFSWRYVPPDTHLLDPEVLPETLRNPRGDSGREAQPLPHHRYRSVRSGRGDRPGDGRRQPEHGTTDVSRGRDRRRRKKRRVRRSANRESRQHGHSQGRGQRRRASDSLLNLCPFYHRLGQSRRIERAQPALSECNHALESRRESSRGRKPAHVPRRHLAALCVVALRGQVSASLGQPYFGTAQPRGQIPHQLATSRSPREASRETAPRAAKPKLE